jgi:hypothetical protein
VKKTLFKTLAFLFSVDKAGNEFFTVFLTFRIAQIISCICVLLYTHHLSSMPSISFLWLLAFWRSFLKLKGLSNMKGTSFPSGRNQFEEMQTKKQGVSIPCRPC